MPRRCSSPLTLPLRAVRGIVPVPIDAVDLEHVLGDIQTNRGNLHLDGSLM